MKYKIRRNKDSSMMFEQALNSAGFTDCMKSQDFDIILYDSENVGRRRDLLSSVLEQVPGFVYPHTPQTCWMWDGVYQELPVCCNFVAAPGQKEAMQIYGYKSRIETVGFPRCEVKDFEPTAGKRLLFVPARPRRDEGRQAARDKKALSFIIKHRRLFKSVTVCHVGQYDGWRIEGMKFIKTVVNKNTKPVNSMLERIDNADLIISATTVAYLAAARGKPVIFYGETEVPETTTGNRPKNFDRYGHLLRFPLTLESMNIDDVFAACSSQSSEVEIWKRNNIGGNFNADKFIEIVREYVNG